MAEPIDVGGVRPHFDADHPVTKDDLDIPYLRDHAGWRTFRKTSLTRAIRVFGPFKVQTSESPDNAPFQCEDGWLAVDARGYPYAIADDEFQRIYEEAGEELGPLEVVTNALAAARSNIALVPGTRETALVKTKLDEAWHWLLHHKEGAPLPPRGREVPGTVVHQPQTGGPHA